MTTDTPFAALVAEAATDPARSQNIAQCEREIDDALALAVVRAMRGKTPREMVGILESSRTHMPRRTPGRDFYIEALRLYLAAIDGKG